MRGDLGTLSIIFYFNLRNVLSRHHNKPKETAGHSHFDVGCGRSCSSCCSFKSA